MQTSFFPDSILLTSPTAQAIYEQIRSLPILDYHCHLDERQIAENGPLSDLGTLWLGGDHYKWRAMRLCGVDERLITSDASPKEKFMAYASILPKLLGSPLYVWTQMELKTLFGIVEPLCPETAEAIFEQTKEMLSEMRVRDLLEKFDVRYIATTDDPMSELSFHGDYGSTAVRPTFRPDRCFAEGISHAVLEKRLDFFVSKGCVIADHGFDFVRGDDENLIWLAHACRERDITLQLHFGTFRNVNQRGFVRSGRDAGYDIMRSSIDTDALVCLLDKLHTQDALPRMILYPLNDAYLRPLATLSGAFPGILVGAAWWFNDTACGIRRQLETVAEYAALGTHPGMLTDSRSFSSYVRFDFYRRILSSFIAEKVDAGEYASGHAVAFAQNLAYFNAKELLKR